MSSRSDLTFEGRTRKQMRKSTARVRNLYVGLRKTAGLPTLMKRRRLARTLPPPAFSIARDKGFLVMPPGRFAEVDEMMQDAHAAVGAADVEANAETSHKAFLVSVLNQADLTLDAPYMRLALRPDILAAVASYLGTMPILEYINVLCSNHVAQPHSKSQLLHCDSDESTQVKIFVLCTEVTPESGPLVVMGADQSQRLRKRIDYRHNHRVTDDEAAAALGAAQDLHPITGPPGTICCVDTSRCFHYGSRVSAPTGRRIVVLLQYVTPWAFTLPPNFSQVARFRRLGAASSDPVARAVLGAV